MTSSPVVLPEGKRGAAFSPWLPNCTERWLSQGRAQPVHLDPCRGLRPVLLRGDSGPRIKRSAGTRSQLRHGAVQRGLGKPPQQAFLRKPREGFAAKSKAVCTALPCLPVLFCVHIILSPFPIIYRRCHALYGVQDQFPVIRVTTGLIVPSQPINFCLYVGEIGMKQGIR